MLLASQEEACHPTSLPSPTCLAVIMLLASQEEARGKLHTAIKLHGTHLACMAAHMFKEVDRSRAEELINLAQGVSGDGRVRVGMARDAWAASARLECSWMRRFHGHSSVRPCTLKPALLSSPHALPVCAPLQCRRIAAHRAMLQQKAIQE